MTAKRLILTQGEQLFGHDKMYAILQYLPLDICLTTGYNMIES